MSKMSKWDKFGRKIIIFESYDEVFLKVYQIVDIKIWFKVVVLDFQGKFMLHPRWENGSFLGKKSILEMFSKSFIRFF